MVENAKDTLCRNVTIYGKCRFEDKGEDRPLQCWCVTTEKALGCAFNHDTTKVNGSQNMEMLVGNAREEKPQMLTDEKQQQQQPEESTECRLTQLYTFTAIRQRCHECQKTCYDFAQSCQRRPFSTQVRSVKYVHLASSHRFSTALQSEAREGSLKLLGEGIAHVSW
jgi:hypothetical protein